MENIHETLGKKSVSEKILDNKFQIFLILFFPIILFFIKNDWIFDNPYSSWIDAWVYQGYFLNFQQYPTIFGSTYYGERISWVLSGYFFNLIFPPLIAQYCLHLLFFILALFSFYVILLLNFNSRIALFSSMLMGTYTLFLQEIGSNYVTGPAITFFLLSFLMMTISGKSNRWRISLLLSGIFFALMSFAAVYAFLFLPTLILYFILIHTQNYERSIFESILSFISGYFGITIILCIINYILIGRFVFFESTIKVSQYYSTINNPWFQPIQTWIFNAYWLYLPVLILISCGLFLFFIKNKENNNYFHIKTFFPLNYIMVFGIFIILIIKGYPFLQFTYFADYLIPFMFLAFAAQLSDYFSNITENQFLVFSISGFCILLSPLLINRISPFASSIIFLYSLQICFALMLFWMLFFIVYCLFIKQKINSSVVLTSLIILLVSIALFNSFVFTKNFGWGFDSKDNGYLAVIDSTKIIKEQVPDQKVKFWYNFSENYGSDYYGGLFNSVNAIYLWGYTYISRDYPNIEQKNLDDLFAKGVKQRKIVIMSTQENLFENTNRTLNTHGYGAVLVSQDQIQRGKIDFNILIIQLEKI